MPDIARGASPVGGGKPAAFLCRARHGAPGAAGQTKAIRDASGPRALPHVFGPIYGTERSSPQLVASKTDRFTTMIPGFPTSHLISQNGQAIYLRFYGRRSQCAQPPSIRRSKPAWF